MTNLEKECFPTEYFAVLQYTKLKNVFRLTCLLIKQGQLC